MNQNTDMGLPGHGHYANVYLEFETTEPPQPDRAPQGFPVFEETTDALYDYLLELTDRVFRDSKNEDVAEAIFDHIHRATNMAEPDECLPVLVKWGGEYRLHAIELNVMGVRDKIGHSVGIGGYRVERT